MELKCNVGTLDRILRVIVGLAVISAGLYFQNYLGLIGILPIATALFGKCPLYYPFGISTCRKREQV